MKSFLFLFFLIPTFTIAKNVKSPYVKQKNNQIKAITQNDLEGLEKGSGMPFGGMAKAAELNGLPGPRHVLDMEEEIQLSKTQKKQVAEIFEKMNREARKWGAELIEIERLMDTKMKTGEIKSGSLQRLVRQSAIKYGELRFSHLVAHLETAKVLSKDQVQIYNKVRGYGDGDPCNNIPPGHPVEMWKKHHGCEP
ncbi:MAG: hypothetical protein AAF203_07400 [Pseudomonadota bacterium]